MRTKTSEASGSVLDFLVANCEGYDIRGIRKGGIQIVEFDGFGLFSPSKWWRDGGLIIERERITIRHWDNEPFVTAYMPISGSLWVHGKDPLEAAMRCYVASKLGEYVDVPDEVQS